MARHKKLPSGLIVPDDTENDVVPQSKAAVPPPMPSSPTTPPPMPTEKTGPLASLRHPPSMPTGQNDTAEKLIDQSPRVIFIHLSIAIGLFLTGLYAPRIVLFYLPLFVLSGVWVSTAGIRLVLIPSRSNSHFLGGMVLLLGVAPLALTVLGVLVMGAATPGREQGDIIVRLLLFLFMGCFVPAAMFVLRRATSRTTSGRLGVLNIGRGIGIAAVLSVLVVGTYLVIVPGAVEEMGHRNTTASSVKTTLDEAHEQWEREERFEAVKQYKKVLREVAEVVSDRDHPVFRERKLQEELPGIREELPLVFRRLIEHEAEYGDPSEARDLCVRAWNDWNLNLTFSSDAAREIWRDVQSELGDTGQPVWKRVLK